MKIQLLAFGEIGEIIGSNLKEEILCHSVSDLKDVMAKKYPELNKIQFKVSVNHQLVSDDFLLSEGNIVALLPPFSGG